MLAQGGSMVTALLLILVLGAVIFSLKMSGTRIVQLKVCRNRSIFLSFILLIVIYFMCYTSLWMQVQEFKGSFEKRIKSYSDPRYSWTTRSAFSHSFEDVFQEFIFFLFVVSQFDVKFSNVVLRIYFCVWIAHCSKSRRKGSTAIDFSILNSIWWLWILLTKQ